MVAVDFVKTENRAIKLNLGTEWTVGSGLRMRAGFNDTEVTAGLGIKFDDWSLDYAFGYQQNLGGVTGMGGTHRLGFSFFFGDKIADSGFSLRWQRKGKLVLELLTHQMEAEARPTDSELEPLVNAAQDVVTHQGFVKAQDLYTAQGYVAYLRGEYARSVQSLSEALALDPQNEQLSKNLAKAQHFMTESQTQNVIAQEMKIMKDLYAKGDYTDAEASCRKVLEIAPDHVEASAYLEDVRRRINEPIAREMKIAKTKIEREEYLDAIKSLQTVLAMDAKNEEAAQMMSQAIASLEKQARLQAKVKKPMLASGSHVYEIDQDPNKSRQLYSQGLMLYSRGKLREALSMWEKAVKMDAYNQLARSAYNRGQAELQESGNTENPASAPMKIDPVQTPPTPPVEKEAPSHQSSLPSAPGNALASGQSFHEGNSHGARIYTVRRGDTLAKIAIRMYGDPKEWKKLYAANRHLLKDGQTLEISQKLFVPDN